MGRKEGFGGKYERGSDRDVVCVPEERQVPYEIHGGLKRDEQGKRPYEKGAYWNDELIEGVGVERRG